MLTPMRNQLIWMTTATLVVISASSAHAISFNTLPGYTDAQFNQDKANGLFQEDWVGEGRIGGPGTFEQDIVNWTTNDPPPTTLATADFPWVSGQAVPFTMSYSPSGGGTLTYTLGGQTITSSNLTEPSRFPNGINTLYLRTRSASANSSLTLQNLVVDGTPLTNLFSTGNGVVDYLQVSELDGNFTLTGEAILSWTGTTPTQSALAFQVKGGYGAVPEPLTLLGVGTALGFGTFFKRALKK